SWQLSSFENANSKDRDEYFSSVFNNLCFYLILFTLLVLTFTKIIIKIIAAPAYYTAWKYVPLLLFSLFFSNISMFLGTNYLVGKRTGG
ncbi:polysaccharide biosynthesis protein, partial [Staphylococcus epidermidis]